MTSSNAGSSGASNLDSPPKLSRREIFDNTLSGAVERPDLPHLSRDDYHGQVKPRSLQDYRSLEGEKEREQRLRAVWHKLPKSKAKTDAALYSKEDDLIAHRSLEASVSSKRTELTKENAQSLWEMYEAELRDQHKVVAWNSFLEYVDRKEVELWSIFHEQLDLDGNGHLDASELRGGLSKAGINMSPAQLTEFMTFLTASPHSHAVSFPEFRDFLLLLPRKASPQEIYRYYQVQKSRGDDGHGVARVNMEGDVTLSAEDRHPPHKSSTHKHHLPSLDDDHSNHESSQDNYWGDDDDDDELEEEDPHASFFVMVGHSQAFKFLLAGGIAGAVSRTATAPFDRLKVYLITRSAGPISLSSAAVSPGEAVKQTTQGAKALVGAVTQLYKEGGLRAFWVGNGLNVIKIFPESAIKFLTYESSKRFLAKNWDKVDDPRDISGTSRFLSGGIGGIFSQFSIYPLETLKTQKMSSAGKDMPVLTCIKHTWALGGVRAYYRGLAVGLIGVFPYSAIDMSTFEALKIAYTKSTGIEEPGVMALLAFGSISGTVGATSVYPLNLVRTRLQASGSPGHPQKYTGYMDATRQVYYRDGWKGFYRGLAPTLAKVIPAVSISYVVYENSKRRLGV